MLFLSVDYRLCYDRKVAVNMLICVVYIAGGGWVDLGAGGWNTCINISMVLFTFFTTDFAAQRMLPDYLPQRLLRGIMAMQLPGAESRHHPAGPPGFCREVSAGGDRATARGNAQLPGLRSFRDR